VKNRFCYTAGLGHLETFLPSAPGMNHRRTVVFLGQLQLPLKNSALLILLLCALADIFVPKSSPISPTQQASGILASMNSRVSSISAD